MFTKTKASNFHRKTLVSFETIPEFKEEEVAKESPADVFLKDMTFVKEIDGFTKEMFHLPSSNVFRLKTVSEDAEKDQQKLYAFFGLWGRLGEEDSESFFSLDHIYYEPACNSVKLALNFTDIFPLKVGSEDVFGSLSSF